MKTIPTLILATAFGVLGLAASGAANAAVILAHEAPKTAYVNPGNIIADGGTVITNPTWVSYIVQDIERPHSEVPTGAEVIRLAGDGDSEGNLQRGNGVVRFDLSAIDDGAYAFSVLMRSNNYKQGNTGAALDRNLSFAVRLVAEGGASFNGVNATPWLIVQPLKDDRNGGGGVRNMEWFELFLTGGEASTDAYSITIPDGVWNLEQALILSGVNGSTGRLFLEVLDPSTLNSATLDVAQFRLTAIPEPSTVAMVGASALVLGVGRRFWKKRGASVRE